MMLIVACHLLQGYNNNLAWILNIGVQLFLILSGFLYGHKFIDNWKEWFLKRFKKLYIPFVLFSIILLACFQCFDLTTVNIVNYLCYLFNIQGFFGEIGELSHLWFMTAIFICYIITPLLQSVRKYSSVVFVLLLLLGMLQYGFLHLKLFHFSWIYLYSVAYFFVNIGNNWQKMSVLFFSIISISAIPFLNSEVLLDFYSPLNRFFHDALGLTLFFWGFHILKNIPSRFTFILRLNNVWDKYSFYIYITHHVFILGSLSLLNVTDNVIINVILVLFVSFLTALLLKAISSFISKNIL